MRLLALRSPDLGASGLVGRCGRGAPIERAGSGRVAGGRAPAFGPGELEQLAQDRRVLFERFTIPFATELAQARRRRMQKAIRGRVEHRAQSSPLPFVEPAQAAAQALVELRLQDRTDARTQGLD